MREFLVKFELKVPDSATEIEIDNRVRDEAVATRALADDGHLVRLWRTNVSNDRMEAIGLFRAGSIVELAGLLDALPLSPWLSTTITKLDQHPNDPTPNTWGK
jgi:muconolactone D-isomerase